MSALNLSLNEINTLAKRASRGAGYPWGLCDEVGKAVRWLHVMNYNGADELAALLSHELGPNLAQHRPKLLGQSWISADGLCPIITGAAITDYASQLAKAPITLGPTFQPMLLLPFIAKVAGFLNTTLRLHHDHAAAMTNGSDITIEGEFLADVPGLGLQVCNRHLSITNARQTRAQLSSDTCDRLSAFAQRTYAPATEASRLSGAGAGTNDND